MLNAVGFGPTRWTVAPGIDAAAVSLIEDEAHVAGDESAGATDAHWEAVSVEGEGC